MIMTNSIIRWSAALVGFAMILGIIYWGYPLPQSSYPVLFISGIVALLLSFLLSIIAQKFDISDRFIYDELEDYEPNLWFIKVFGTRIIKSKSNSNVVYTFFHIMYVPTLPIGCHGYTFEKGLNSQETEIYWCGAKWNILDLAIIYLRWVGFIMIFAGLVKVLS